MTEMIKAFLGGQLHGHGQGRVSQLCSLCTAALLSVAFLAAGPAREARADWTVDSNQMARYDQGHGAWGASGSGSYTSNANHWGKPRRSKKSGWKSYAASDRGVSRRKKAKGYRVASLGNSAYEASRPSQSLTGGVRWSASSTCLNGTLVSVVQQVAASYGSVTVNSTCRSRGHNAAVGGAKHSHHLNGNAVDFRVRGNPSPVLAYLRSSGSVGGIKHYGGGLFHVDTGPRRTW